MKPIDFLVMQECLSKACPPLLYWTSRHNCSCDVLQASSVFQGKELGDAKVGPMAGGNEDHTMLHRDPAVF